MIDRAFYGRRIDAWESWSTYEIVDAKHGKSTALAG